MVIYPEPFNVTFGFGNSAGVDDFQMVEDLIATLDANYSINLNDVCIGGFSNGAIFSYNLVCDFNGQDSTRSYTFKSLAIVSGAMGTGLANGTDCPVAGTVPAIVFHGTQDPVIAYSDGNVPPPVSLATEATETTVAFWTNEVNGCGSNPEVTALPDAVAETPAPSTVELLEYSCASSPGSKFYRILGGLHAWPGGNANFGCLAKPKHGHQCIPAYCRIFRRLGPGFHLREPTWRRSDFGVPKPCGRPTLHRLPARTGAR